MTRPRPRRNFYLFALLILLLLAGCEGEMSVLDPRGEGAEHIARLWWIMLIVGAVVYLQVIAFVGLALFRRRTPEEIQTDAPTIAPESPRARNFIIANGIAIPVVILTVIFGFNLQTLSQLSPAGSPSEIVIEVIGHRFWWEVRYPQYDIVTANEIVIPVGTRVELKLTSEDVIHSLWVPSLNGKADMIPGNTNSMRLYTENVGEYRGHCAELCGLQHAKMRFTVSARQPDDFAAWIVAQQEVPSAPRTVQEQRGQQIFLGAACVYCHTVRGTNASGIIGPDLTHFASRPTIGAGAMENNLANLAGWIIDPQSIKPGNRMPPMYIEGEDLQALLAYLATLE